MKQIFKAIIICALCTFNLIASAEEPAATPATQTPATTAPKPFQNIYKPNALPGPKVNIPGTNGQAGQSATQEQVNQYISQKVLPRIAIRLTSFITIAAFLGLLYSGFLYLTALEQTDNYQKAKSVAVYSIVGLIVAFMAYSIVQLVFSFPLID